MTNAFDFAIATWFSKTLSTLPVFYYPAKILSVINEAGQMWYVILVGLLIYESIKNKKFSFYYLFAFACVGLGWLLSEKGVKVWVGRLRPVNEVSLEASSYFHNLCESIGYDIPSSNSFPSGHSVIGWGCAFIIFLRDKKFGIPALVLAFLISLSRMILGAHYFTDVLTGAVWGTACGIIGYFVSSKVSPLLENKLFKKSN